MRKDVPEEKNCGICLHSYPKSEITVHHLIPKSRGGTFGETVLLCRACHRQVHALFTEKELAQRYSTVSELLQNEQMQRWANWIRKRKPTSRVNVRSSRRKREL